MRKNNRDKYAGLPTFHIISRYLADRLKICGPRFELIADTFVRVDGAVGAWRFAERKLYVDWTETRASRP